MKKVLYIFWGWQTQPSTETLNGGGGIRCSRGWKLGTVSLGSCSKWAHWQPKLLHLAKWKNIWNILLIFGFLTFLLQPQDILRGSDLLSKAKEILKVNFQYNRVWGGATHPSFRWRASRCRSRQWRRRCSQSRRRGSSPGCPRLRYQLTAGMKFKIPIFLLNGGQTRWRHSKSHTYY